MPPGRRRASARARTSGTTPRPTRSRTAPPTRTAGSRPRCSAIADWDWPGRRARPRLRHRLPPAALRGHARTSVIGVEPHPDLVGAGPAAYPLARRTSTVLARHRPGAPAARRLGRRRARAVGLLLRARAASRGWPSWTGSYAAAAPRSSSTTTRPARPSAAGSGAATRRSTRSAVERFWSTRGWTADPGRHGLAFSLAAPTSRPWSASSSPASWPSEVLAEHEGTEVDYAVNLWWRGF